MANRQAPLNNDSALVSLCDQVLDFVDLNALKLGDKRRHLSYMHNLLGLSHRPSLPLPERFEHSQLIRHYRFVGSPYFGMKKLIAPLTSRAAQQMESRPDVTAYVIHDTTRLSWQVHHNKPRLHLSRLSSKTQGFFIHTSLLFEAGSTPNPLGVLDVQAFVHRKDVEKDPETLAFWVEREGVFEHEPQRWQRGVEASAKQLGSAAARVIHLMDAETDDWSLLSHWSQQGHRFICRLAQERRIVPLDDDIKTVRQALAQASIRGVSEVEVQEREKSQTHKTYHPAREARTAQLELRSCTVQVRRPQSAQEGPDEISLNLVQARELHPPSGEEPILWVLATQEPVESLEDCLAILKGYKCRWLTEEFYKAIKTGCNFSELQLESASSLLNEWALMMPVALSLLRLRVLAQATPEVVAEEVVTSTQVEVLNTFVSRTQLTLQSPLHLVMVAIAKLGGYIRGPIGWLVLGRGYMRLLEYERVWRAASLARSQVDVL